MANPWVIVQLWNIVAKYSHGNPHEIPIVDSYIPKRHSTRSKLALIAFTRLVAREEPTIQAKDFSNNVGMLSRKDGLVMFGDVC